MSLSFSFWAFFYQVSVQYGMESMIWGGMCLWSAPQADVHADSMLCSSPAQKEEDILFEAMQWK